MARRLSAERLRKALYLDIDEQIADIKMELSKPGGSSAGSDFASYHERRTAVGPTNLARSAHLPPKSTASSSDRLMKFSFTPSTLNTPNSLNQTRPEHTAHLDSFQVDNLTVPAFLYLSTKFLLKHGLGMDGLFQRHGSEIKINALKNKIKGKCKREILISWT